MVPKSGSRLPKSPIFSDADFAAVIAAALQTDLGASRRATKMVMTWAEVSDRTARAWLNGRCCPSGRHLVLLAAKCRPVMAAMLRLSGHEKVALAIDLQSMETMLGAMLETVRKFRRDGPNDSIPTTRDAAI